MDPLIGRELEGRYRLLAALGEGAMGRVYRAERLDGAGPVAIKVLNEDCSENPDLRERFEREARALFGLSHPHILDVQDYGVIDGRQPFLVMELLTGGTLEALVEATTLPPDAALELARQLMNGLAFAHSQGAVHRDLKAENVWVEPLPDGRFHLKLLDFGLVKFVDDHRWGEGRKLTVAGSVMGSPAYMSPEQGTGGATDARSDVYSAGVVLYELFTGTWPFMGESRMDMLKGHLLMPVPALAAGRPDLVARPELDALIQKAMAKDADDRFADAQQMAAALEAIARPVAWLQALPPPTPSYRPAGMMPLPPSPNVPVGASPSVHHGAQQQAVQQQAVQQPAVQQPAMQHAAQAPLPVAAPPVEAPRKTSPLLPLLLLGAVVAFCLFGGLAAGLVVALR